MKKTDSGIYVFVAIAYALSILLSLFVGLTGGYQSRWIGFGYLSMLIPAVSVLFTKATTGEQQRLTGWDRFPWRYVPVALFLMPVVMHAVMLPLAAAMGRLHWEPWLISGTDGLYHSPASWGWGALNTAGLVERITINAALGMIVVSILALFEEIGWRGWLLERLRNRIGTRLAIVISSLIWAAWHVPYVLAGILHLDGIPLMWTVLILPVGIFGSGLVIGWLWQRTESIWIVSVAHGALNNWGQYAFKFVSGPGQPSDSLVLAGGALALIVVGAILVFYGPRKAGQRILL